MRISKVLNLVTAIFILLVITNGCISNSQEDSTQNPTSTMAPTAAPSQAPAPVNTLIATPQPTPKITPKPTPKQTSFLTSEEKALLLGEDLAKSPIMKNGVTLEDVAIFMNISEEDLLEEYGENLEWVRDYYEYQEYLYSNLGINIVCYAEDRYNDYHFVKYIEFEDNKIVFNGITADMNFAEVISILGNTKIITLEDGLPGLYTYELRYRYEDIYLRIFSWDELGEGGIHFSIVDKYLPEYRTIRITPEQIDVYFEMTKEELEEKLKDKELSYDKDFIHTNAGATFRFDEEGKRLFLIALYSNYQINELKKGVRLEEAIRIMGKTKIRELQSEEEGYIYIIEYEYNNYLFKIKYYVADGWATYWQIFSYEYLNS